MRQQTSLFAHVLTAARLHSLRPFRCFCIALAMQGDVDQQ